MELQFNAREKGKSKEGKISKLDKEKAELIAFTEHPMFKLFFYECLDKRIEEFTESILTVDTEGKKIYTGHDVDRKVLQCLRLLREEPRLVMREHGLGNVLDT